MEVTLRLSSVDTIIGTPINKWHVFISRDIMIVTKNPFLLDCWNVFVDTSNTLSHSRFFFFFALNYLVSEEYIAS